MITPTNDDIHRNVKYIPNHANGDPYHNDCKIGRITSMNDMFVFVKYGPGDTSAGTKCENLIWVPTLYNKRRDVLIPRNAVYIGRPSKWGNPFTIGKDGTREQVVDKYFTYLNGNQDLMEMVKKELCGRDLVCWCTPMPCHGDVLLEIANE